MIRETFKRVIDSMPTFRMSQILRDRYDGRGIKGEVFWEMRDSVTGAVTKGRLKNVVTLDASVLIARLMKGTGTPVAHLSEPSFGIFGLAVGTGDVSWDPLRPPSPTVSQRSLFNELARKAVSSTSFIDGGGAVSGVPTNVVDFITTIAEAEAVGALTEMGLIGGDVDPSMAIRNPVLPPNGTYDPTVNLVGLDTLVNYLTFPVISKPATATLSWTWRISV